MRHFDSIPSEEPSFLRRYRGAIAFFAILTLGSIGAVVHFCSKRQSAPRREAPLNMVSLAMPTPYPTPPPAPTPPPPPPEEKMVEQTPLNEVEEKPDPNPAPKEEAPVSTNIVGNGPDGFGLSSKGGAGFGSKSTNRGSGSRWGWYASQVQSRIAEALRNNRKTRIANLSLQVRIWPDSTGRITRAKLAASTGDRALDEILQNEILTGLQLQEPPPAGMPMPIVMRVTARRPN